MTKKVPDYTRRANDAYRKRKDTISIVVPYGTRERIKEAIRNESMASYIYRLIDADLSGSGAAHVGLTNPDGIMITLSASDKEKLNRITDNPAEWIVNLIHDKLSRIQIT